MEGRVILSNTMFRQSANYGIWGALHSQAEVSFGPIHPSYLSFDAPGPVEDTVMAICFDHVDPGIYGNFNESNAIRIILSTNPTAWAASSTEYKPIARSGHGGKRFKGK